MRRLGRELDGPVGDVLAAGDSGDVVPRVLGGDVPAGRSDDDDEFGFVVGGLRPQFDLSVRADDAARYFVNTTGLAGSSTPDSAAWAR